MTSLLSLEHQRNLLADLHRLAAEREAAEKRVHKELADRTETIEREFRVTREQVAKSFQAELAELQRQFDAALSSPNDDYQSQHATAAAELEEARERVQEKYSDREQEANKQLDQDTWQATTVFEAAHPGLLEQFERVQAKVAGTTASLNKIVDLTWQYLDKCRLHAAWEAQPIEDRPVDAAGDPFSAFPRCADRAIVELDQLQRLVAPKLFIDIRPQLIGVAIFVLAMTMSALLAPSIWLKLGVGVASSAVAIIAALLWLHHRAFSQAAAKCAAIRRALADGDVLKEQCQVDAKAYYEAQWAKMAKRHRRDIRKAKERQLTRMNEIISDRDGTLTEADDAFHRREANLVARRESMLRDSNEKYPGLLAERRTRFERESADAQSRYDRSLKESRQRHESEWATLEQDYRSGMQQVYAVLAEMTAESEKYFPDWDGPGWQAWTPPDIPPPAIRFGDTTIRLDQIRGGISSDARLQPPGPTELSLPALLPFPHNASLLIQAAGEGRAAAVQVLQSVMLRMLATIPPGKLRYTIIDPVGLGENFAGFMHLADFDDVLVTNRIWTEPQHIEARLADLTEQMENVIQKYLRNDFQSIAEYNVFAGEVAEAFRILVVANFPVNFTESAARRLTSIAASGARCGVYVLMTTDSGQPLPMRFDMKDIEAHSTNLTWDAKAQSFKWKQPDLGKYPLTVDTPPPEERFTQIVQLVGENAKDSRRVQVPFEYIAPADDKWWAGSTSHGIDVPLGRAGATKLQHLRLGHGTSQHVLVAGKTGSGKSTLLHALITNLALTYSPAEIELYLIDFKKGVEFKTYATHELPHARVIAIESEREFGISVLQSLDAELKRRGDVFRNLGVQDLASFRSAQPGATMPRVLLVVDEFQELFVEDDKLAQDATLLLDRLVRQGRAFGIHVMLGSQTLGGAYSLARSTIGQMAVRIALQCSENDAHLILSEDNSAARLLSRPGEAIYNDANGMVIGNNPFQVVWLSDERREVYLKDLHQRAMASVPPFVPKQIVFEGNVPADISRNRLLHALLSADSLPSGPRDPAAWMGEAIAIKDPTAAVFRPQNGCNLLIIGQRDEAARAILATAMLSLAAQRLPARGKLPAPPPPEPERGLGSLSLGSPLAGIPLGNMAQANGAGPEASHDSDYDDDRPAATNGNGSHGGHALTSEARFYLLEPTRAADRPGPTLAELAATIPHPVRVAGRRDVPQVIAEIAAEVQRRQATDHADAPAIYLFIYDLGRFRDLRKGEEFGYSFGTEAKAVSPGVQFSDILREGPAVGVYTITWCDTLNNLNRTVDRQGLREFDLRVLFQMSGADSSQLIDTPLAGKLGPHLALYYNEEEGRAEKFRPYAWPSSDWLAWAGDRLTQIAATADVKSAPRA